MKAAECRRAVHVDGDLHLDSLRLATCTNRTHTYADVARRLPSRAQRKPRSGPASDTPSPVVNKLKGAAGPLPAGSAVDRVGRGGGSRGCRRAAAPEQRHQAQAQPEQWHQAQAPSASRERLEPLHLARAPVLDVVAGSARAVLCEHDIGDDCQHYDNGGDDDAAAGAALFNDGPIVDGSQARNANSSSGGSTPVGPGIGRMGLARLGFEGVLGSRRRADLAIMASFNQVGSRKNAGDGAIGLEMPPGKRRPASRAAEKQ